MLLERHAQEQQVHASVQLWLLLRGRTDTATPSVGAVDLVRLPQAPSACSEQVDNIVPSVELLVRCDEPLQRHRSHVGDGVHREETHEGSGRFWDDPN